MRTFEYVCFEIASSSYQPLCCFAKTDIKSYFKRVFYSFIKKLSISLVIIIRFCHRLIIHDDKTVISYFMPGH